MQGFRSLPQREGPKPATTAGLPHKQLDQQPADDELRQRLAARLFALPGVTEGRSGVSVPGARALVLDRSSAGGPPDAFFIEGEFAHLHPGGDHSLHVCLPSVHASHVIVTGWGEPHPLVASGGLPNTHIMIFAPRNDRELEVVTSIVEASYKYALGGPLMSIKGFRHIGLTVSDLERSAEWYARVLGFRELFREAEGGRSAVIMGAPRTELILGLVHFADGPNDGFSPLRTGLDHLCLAVADRSDVEAWVARLDEHGVGNVGVEEMKTGPIVHFKDPDGIALAISVPPRSPAAVSP